MCVAITMDPGSELTLAETVKMNRANADGLGVSWVQDGMVHWYKTTRGDLRQLTKLINHYKDSPRLVHFRFATVGGTRADLCHPFEVGPLATCKPQGSSSLVMIHNGHWHRWKEVHDILDKENLLPDNGPWSDSRMAALQMYQDMDWVHALGGRVATMDGEGVITRWGDWDKLREGVQVSNKHWDTTGVSYKRGGYTGYRQWKGWDWDDEDWVAFEAEQRALVKLQLQGTEVDAGESCDPSVMYSWGDNHQVKIKDEGHGQEQASGQVKTSRRTRQSTEPLPNAGQGVDRRALPSPEGDPEAANGDPGESSNPGGRRVSGEPWTHPYTGEVFKARPDGTVVKVAPEGVSVPNQPPVETRSRQERGYYSESESSRGDGDFEDLTRLQEDVPDERYGG